MSDKRVYGRAAILPTLSLMNRFDQPCPKCRYPEADVWRCVRRHGELDLYLVCRECNFDWLHVEDGRDWPSFFSLGVDTNLPERDDA